MVLTIDSLCFVAEDDMSEVSQSDCFRSGFIISKRVRYKLRLQKGADQHNPLDLRLPNKV